jgi:uncharacterized membrane protein YqjE
LRCGDLVQSNPSPETIEAWIDLRKWGYLASRRMIAAMGGAMFIKQRLAIVEWAEDHENLFDNRAVIVLALYFLSAIIFGVAAWKAVVIGAAAYGLVLMRIGPRPIAVLGVLFFLAALTGWSGFGDIRQCFKG